MRHCGFRPKNSADAEVGCPLDHCAHCGQHDHEDAPCAEMMVDKRHNEWKDRVLLEAFEKWWQNWEHLSARRGESLISGENARRLAWDAFMFGLGFGHEMNEYTMGDCGQPKCEACHPSYAEDEDPMGGPGRYV